jgi:peptidoglycan/xylan/chitin deacetylase (PgdA/CDA1 family)
MSELMLKSIAALSVDMDNQWSYMKTHGDAGWESYPSYFAALIPYLLDILDEQGLSTTFFLVGIDVKRQENQRYLRMITDRGHESGNHSLTHEPWLHLLPKDRIREELRETHDAIMDVCGAAPIGFRGPGFSWSVDLLEVLLEMGYRYDASTLPTFIGPLARMYYFWTAKLDKDQRTERRKLFGTVADGLRPVRPYTWLLPDERRILELPVTTIPVFRTPFHMSYLLYLSRYSEWLMERYLQVAVMMCEATGTQPSFLLHPLDVLGGDQVPELKFFPGMDIDGPTKRRQLVKVMKILRRHFKLLNMSRYADLVTDAASGRIVSAGKP